VAEDQAGRLYGDQPPSTDVPDEELYTTAERACLQVATTIRARKE
jgi:hypothetical protein